LFWEKKNFGRKNTSLETGFFWFHAKTVVDAGFGVHHWEEREKYHQIKSKLFENFLTTFVNFSSNF